MQIKALQLLSDFLCLEVQSIGFGLEEKKSPEFANRKPDVRISKTIEKS